METVEISGLVIEGRYSDGDFAVYVGAGLVFFTPRQMMVVAETILDRLNIANHDSIRPSSS